MSDGDIESDERTDRRTILKSFAAGAGGSAVFFGAANVAASSGDDDDVEPAYCEEEVTQYQCVDSGCDCSGCDCECETVREQRTCCRDPYGDIVNCGAWQSTGECCTSC